jgi:hypothetical protein
LKSIIAQQNKNKTMKANINGKIKQENDTEKSAHAKKKEEKV